MRHLRCVDDASGPNFAGPEFSPSLVTTHEGTWLYFSSTGYDANMDLYVIRRPSAWANLKELEAAGAKSARIGNEEMSDRVRWIRSYVVNEPDGRIGTFCIYEARDPESIREHARRVGMPGDQIFPVVTTVIVREDPKQESAAA